MNDADVSLRRLPPERGRRSTSLTLACGCSSCCCCCCLHTAGATVGALVGSVTVPREQKAGASPVVATFWGTTVGVTLLSLLVALAMTGSADADVLLFVGVGALVLFPVVLLAAAVPALIVAAVQPPEARGAGLRAVGRIVGGGVLGAVLGTLLMAVLGGALGALSGVFS